MDRITSPEATLGTENARALAWIDREVREQEKRAAQHARKESAHHRHLYTANRMRLLAERIRSAINAEPNEAPGR